MGSWLRKEFEFEDISIETSKTARQREKWTEKQTNKQKTPRIFRNSKTIRKGINRGRRKR